MASANKNDCQRDLRRHIREIFYVSPNNNGCALHLIDLKEAEGEIGLRAGTSEKYFAVINIGEKREFLKLFEERNDKIFYHSLSNR